MKFFLFLFNIFIFLPDQTIDKITLGVINVAFLLKGRYCLACSIPLFYHSKTRYSMLNFQACIFIDFQSLLFSISLCYVFLQQIYKKNTKGFRAITNTRKENNHKENCAVQMKINKTKINKKFVRTSQSSQQQAKQDSSF